MRKNISISKFQLQADDFLSTNASLSFNSAVVM